MNLDMEVKLRVKDKAFEGNVKEVVHINEAILTDEFVKQPSVYAWFATLAEIASAEVESRKLDLSVLEANLDREKRVQYAEAKEKVTEAVIKSAIVTDKRYIVANQELIEAERQLGILKALVRALEQRKDMLIQLGAVKRQEMLMADISMKRGEHN